MKTTVCRTRRLFVMLMLLVSTVAAGATNADAQQQPQSGLVISYEVGMSRPTTHLYEVTMTVERLASPTFEVQFPVWSPGAYRVEDPVRNVQEFRASTTGGQLLPANKTATNTWRVETRGANAVRLTYKVYADYMNVSGIHLDDTHAFFNGTWLFPYVVGAKDRPVTLKINRPPRWTNISTGMDAVANRPDTFSAPDYDTFVDSPVEVSAHQVMRFDYRGVPYEIAIHGTHNYDTERFRREVEAIVRSQVDMMGGAPFRRYVFIYHMLPNGRGGLEHLNSTAINRRKWIGNTEEGWDLLRGVTSHEFFHLWNVKRLRPEPLGPFDYTRQVPTRDLYVSEGMTSYYGDLHIRRAGLWTNERYYKKQATLIAELQGKPARTFLTAEESSFNTWLKPDDAENATYSYYTKGDLIGMLLDLEIRQRTKNARTLDDVFRFLYERYALPKPGWPPGGFEQAVEEVAGSDFTEFFTRYVAGTEELPYERVLGYAGLRLERKEAAMTHESLGLKIETENIAPEVVGLKVTHVSAESPAFNVLVANDILLAIAGERVTAATLPAQLARFKAGERVPMSVFRDDRLLDVSMTMLARPAITYTITEDPSATPEQKALREAWLTGRRV
jgi:predicted metalloprotease with PDZ domain